MVRGFVFDLEVVFRGALYRSAYAAIAKATETLKERFPPRIGMEMTESANLSKSGSTPVTSLPRMSTAFSLGFVFNFLISVVFFVSSSA
jgi:hypothetical protein